MIKAAPMKTKTEAAEYLGISTRQVANYAKQGKLSVQYQKGKTGDVAMYDERELKKLRAELESKHAPRPAVIREENEQGDESRALVPSFASNPSHLPTVQNLFAALLSGKATPAPTISDLAAKPLLTIAEAQKLSGLSRQIILDAHHAGKLKLIVIGRGYKVKRKDLDLFINKL
jgi:excisionase family DNA binding protein